MEIHGRDAEPPHCTILKSLQFVEDRSVTFFVACYGQRQQIEFSVSRRSIYIALMVFRTTSSFVDGCEVFQVCQHVSYRNCGLFSSSVSVDCAT